MSGDNLKKIVTFWNYVEKKYTMPVVPKPLNPSQDSETGKLSLNLWLLLPPWFANYATSLSKKEICSVLMAANFLNSPDLIELLSIRLASEIIADPQYFKFETHLDKDSVDEESQFLRDLARGV